MFCTGHINCFIGSGNLQNVATIIRTEVSLQQSFTDEARALRKFVTSKLQIFVKPGIGSTLFLALSVSVFTHVFFVKVYQEARLNAQVFAQEPVGRVD